MSDSDGGAVSKLGLEVSKHHDHDELGGHDHGEPAYQHHDRTG